MSKLMSRQLREIIDASGLTRYRICKDAGLDQGLLSKFMAGKCGLGIESIDAIGKLLGVKLVATVRASKTKGR